MYFLNKQQLLDTKQSYDFYKDKPLAYVFYAEMIRKGLFDSDKLIYSSYFIDFFTRHSDDKIEVIFNDFSFLAFDFKESKSYVMCPSSHYFKVFELYSLNEL